MTENINEKPLTIVEFRAQNAQVLKAVQIFPGDRNIVKITGKNRQGKSTILKSIMAALGGKNFIDDQPVRNGESEAEIFLDLGEYTITRKITLSGEYLDVRTKEGFKAPSPQKFLTSKLSSFAHNPLEFMRLKKEAQVEALRKIAPVRLDRAEIESVIGGKWIYQLVKSDDPLVILDKAYAAIYEERTITNREITRLNGAIKSIVIPGDGADIEPISASELLAEKSKLDEKKATNDAVRKQLLDTQAGLALLTENIADIDNEINELEEKLTLLRDKKNNLEIYFQSADFKRTELSMTIDGLVDPDYDEIDKKIAGIDEHNKLANDIHIAKNSREKSMKELASHQADSERCSKNIEAIKQYKTQLMTEANLPVAGLNIENGMVTYGGFPLSQASTKEQIEISCAVCLAEHPKIGVITIDRGWADLDSEGKQALQKFAENTGAQIWITQVLDEPGADGFHIVSGELAAVDGMAIEEEE